MCGGFGVLGVDMVSRWTAQPDWNLGQVAEAAGAGWETRGPDLVSGLVSALDAGPVPRLSAPAAALLPAPVFFGDWESGVVFGNDNHSWDDVERVAPDRFQLVHDASRPGTYARVEVRPGDNPLDFCCDGTERSEVVGMQRPDGSLLNEDAQSGIQTLRFSVKFDQSWQVISDVSPDHSTGAWGIFLQLHGPNASNPAFAFSATDEIRFNTRGGDITQGGYAAEHDLSDGGLAIGQWIDFELTVGFAADNTGFFVIRRHDAGETGFETVLTLTGLPTLQFDPGVNGGAVGGHYWKHGLYRNAQDFTSVLYLDGLTRQGGALRGTGQDDQMQAKAQGSALQGLGGNDLLQGAGAADSLFGASGDDRLLGGAGDDFAVGGAGADLLAGGLGRDLLQGGAGADLLVGGAGADRLLGEAGADRLRGGDGADRFVFDTTSGSRPGLEDRVMDFAPGLDRLDLHLMDADAGRAGNQAFVLSGFGTGAGALRLVAAGAGTWVEGDLNGDGRADFRLWVAGVQGLTAADFLL